jgi:hypothetical protein
MWYKFAAFGTIDLQKYVTEDLNEDFDVEEEIKSLLSNSVGSRGIIDFDILNFVNLPKSKLKSYISVFKPQNNPRALASYNSRLKEVKLSNLPPGKTIDDLIQDFNHELRHALDKGHDRRPKWISNYEINLVTDFFFKYKNIITNPETNELKYDQKKLSFLVAYYYLRTSEPDFDKLPDNKQNELIEKTISDNFKRPDQIKEIIERLLNGESRGEISDHYAVNNPQEYTTFLSDVNDFFSPQAFKLYFDQLSYMDREQLIESIRYTLTRLPNNLTLSTLKNINYQGAHLVSKILYFSENEEMKRNIYKILNKNFQEFLSEYTKEEVTLPDQTKEAKKGYNAPRTGKKKKRWSVKYKKSINCNSPKGFSQKNYCKRKRSGGQYKTEG